MVETLQLPTLRAVPPILFTNASSLFVSLKSLQQLESIEILSLTKKLESDHFILWIADHLANSSSWNLPSL